MLLPRQVYAQAFDAAKGGCYVAAAAAHAVPLQSSPRSSQLSVQLLPRSPEHRRRARRLEGLLSLSSLSSVAKPLNQRRRPAKYLTLSLQPVQRRAALCQQRNRRRRQQRLLKSPSSLCSNTT